VTVATVEPTATVEPSVIAAEPAVSVVIAEKKKKTRVKKVIQSEEKASE
jgi:hypothetical protein